MFKYVEISTKFVQYYSDKLCFINAKLIHSSISTCTFPEVIKIDKVTPIYKSGKIDNVTKLFEAFISNLIKEHCYVNHIITNSEFGFVDKSNRMNICVELVNFISSAINKKMYVACIFLANKIV